MTMNHKGYMEEPTSHEKKEKSYETMQVQDSVLKKLF